jgi:hypothetical protein
LAQFLFDSEDAMVRIDMSEFMEKHAVSRLVGAPPGYVGYEEGGYLTEAVRRRPYSVILLDEVEKAHPDVFNVLLQVLDDGRITDGQGRTVDFKNTVIILTSNIGSRRIIDAAGDREKAVAGVMEELRRTLKPEFLNRIDDVIVFDALTRPNMDHIFNIQLKRVKKLLASRSLDVTVTDQARTALCDAGFDPVYGARPLKRAIQTHLLNPMSKAIVGGDYGAGDTVKVTLDGDDIVYVARVESRKIMRVQITVGTRFPAYVTSMGRVLLADLDPTAAERILTARDRSAFTPHTTTDVAGLMTAISLVREAGYSLVDQELEMGLRSLAVPVRDGSGRVVAAINVSTTAAGTPRDTLEAVLPALLTAQSDIEGELASLVR